MIYTDGPVVGVEWDDVEYIHCTLETPFKGGGLRFRLGTRDAKRNLSYNAYDPKNRHRFFPGSPIMYPEDAPAVAGTEHNWWLMPAAIGATTVNRMGQQVPDGARHAGFTAFGFFMAPLEEEDGLVGFTQSAERSRVVAFWHQFKFPSDRDNKGRNQPQMSRIAPPDVPDVTVRPLSKSMQPIRVNGAEVAIRIREYWNLDDPRQYEAAETLPQLPAQNEMASLMQGLTPDEVRALIAIARKGAANGAK